MKKLKIAVDIDHTGQLFYYFITEQQYKILFFKFFWPHEFLMKKQQDEYFSTMLRNHIVERQREYEGLIIEYTSNIYNWKLWFMLMYNFIDIYKAFKNI